MNVRLSKYKASSPADVLALERLLGTKLPRDLVEFVLEFDGAACGPNRLASGVCNECEVTAFIPVKEMFEVKSTTECLPEGMIPVANAPCGNLILVSLAPADGVWYWDHEVADSPQLIASTFTEFLADLVPREDEEVTLEEGQVLDVWVDPELRRMMEDQQ